MRLIFTFLARFALFFLLVLFAEFLAEPGLFGFGFVLFHLF